MYRRIGIQNTNDPLGKITNNPSFRAYNLESSLFRLGNVIQMDGGGTFGARMVQQDIGHVILAIPVAGQ